MYLRRLVCLGTLSLVLSLFISKVRAADIEKYLPEETEAVLYINFRQALDSALGKKYLLSQFQESLKSQPEAQELMTAIGLDPLKDLHSLTCAAPGKISEKKGTVVLRGNFDEGKFQTALEAFVKKQSMTLKIGKEGGINIYEYRD